ncbi:MAG TPA: arsenate reductase ArsC [Methylophilaceae bacterium]|nr:arsenate reductase ArsC [Methylophilaceae bacterium]
MKVLFLCTGNSCRSILAEAVFNNLAPAGMRASSAGSNPTGVVHPRSIALLARKGIPAEGYYSKSWSEITAKPDLVVTVCNNAAGEACPAFLGDVKRVHWDIEDPARATGTDAEIEAKFEEVFSILERNIKTHLLESELVNTR